MTSWHDTSYTHIYLPHLLTHISGTPIITHRHAHGLYASTAIDPDMHLKGENEGLRTHTHTHTHTPKSARTPGSVVSHAFCLSRVHTPRQTVTNEQTHTDKHTHSDEKLWNSANIKTWSLSRMIDYIDWHMERPSQPFINLTKTDTN